MKGLRKKVMIILIIAVLIVILMQLFNRSDAVKSESPDRAPEESYEMVIENELAFVCPINCENDKSYVEPGNCPVCDMPLKALNEEDITQSKISELDSISPAKNETEKGSTDQN